MQQLLGVFEPSRHDDAPLLVPITLINHFVHKYDQPYLNRQTCLHPHPLALKLRAHVQ